jgi:hypothetical protein
VAVDAVLVCGDVFFLTSSKSITASVARHSLPAMYNSREYMQTGGLISYGSGLIDAHRRTKLQRHSAASPGIPADGSWVCISGGAQEGRNKTAQLTSRGSWFARTVASREKELYKASRI